MHTSLVPAGIASAPARNAPGVHARQQQVSAPGWQVVSQVAEGRFTAIYQASALDRGCDSAADYVLKLLRPEHLGNKIARAELANEALVSREISHSRLTSVLAPIHQAECYGLVMPLLEGASVAHVIASQQNRRWPISKALWVARQVAEALAVMHGQGWLHGQIQPRHMMVSPHGDVTLIDLSQARRSGSPQCGGAPSLQQTTYAAPEYGAPARACSSAGDIYSLGIVLYELLAGRPPFASCDPTRLMAMHRHALPEDIRHLRPDVLLELAQLLRRMLAKEPLRRPSSQEVVRWLAELEIVELACF